MFAIYRTSERARPCLPHVLFPTAPAHVPRDTSTYCLSHMYLAVISHFEPGTDYNLRRILFRHYLSFVTTSFASPQRRFSSEPASLLSNIPRDHMHDSHVIELPVRETLSPVTRIHIALHGRTPYLPSSAHDYILP